MSDKIDRIAKESKGNLASYFGIDELPSRAWTDKSKIEMLRNKINEIIDVVNDIWKNDN